MTGQQARQDTPLNAAETIAELSARLGGLEAELDRAQRLATLGTLAGAIAHEFNNILTPVMSYAQLALASPEDRELAHKALLKAVDGTEKAAEICASMLGFLRDEQATESASVEEVVRAAMSCLPRAPAKDGIKVELIIAPGACVAMRPVALQQVLLNLMLNAREAILPRSGVLTVCATSSTWNTPDQASMPVVRLEISDTGRGMPEDKVARLFTPFFTDRRGEAHGTGHGLGLMVCKRLVTQAGGTIDVSSREGEGTTFTIVLPASVAAASSVKPAKAA